jgi:ATP-binding cassette subfamily B protein
VGPNGTGKTSLVSLILGLYRPTGGRLSADGHPFDDLDLDDIRRSIGVVTQDPVMIPGTIWENLTYGRDSESPAGVVQAAELATAHGFIQSLPLAYETPIGEEGVLLSGGQRQRLAIARALVRAPALLILDEPTNHLDADSVRALLSNLKHLPNRPAILIITHAPDVAAEADRLFVLDDRGQLSEGDPASPAAAATRP